MSFANPSENRFLTAPPGRLFLANALPMTVVMTMNGLLTVADAAFLGHYVGPDALAAVSIVFPPLMVATALSVLVGGGMSSLLARHLGAGRHAEAEAVFARAHGLALALALALIAAFLACGSAVIGRVAAGQPEIGHMAHLYLAILIFASPVQLLLGIHADAWRNEGKAGLVALLSIGITLGNIGLNYLLIVVFELGTAGSAWGTVLAQGAGLAILAGLRLRGVGTLPLAGLLRTRWTGGWRPILGLGAPVSLGFVGIALVSASVIAALRLTAGPAYAETVAAYGIITRIFSFTFLPAMAIALANQAIVGNNVGARLYRRSDAALRIALLAALTYGAVVEAVLLLGRNWIGAGFVGDPAVVARVATILRPMAALYLCVGPILVLALYFQAIGKPLHAAALALAKPFAVTPALIAALAALFGAEAIWFAVPVADAAVALVALGLGVTGRRSATGFGMAGAEAAP